MVLLLNHDQYMARKKWSSRDNSFKYTSEKYCFLTNTKYINSSSRICIKFVNIISGSGISFTGIFLLSTGYWSQPLNTAHLQIWNTFNHVMYSVGYKNFTSNLNTNIIVYRKKESRTSTETLRYHYDYYHELDKFVHSILSEPKISPLLQIQRIQYKYNDHC